MMSAQRTLQTALTYIQQQQQQQQLVSVFVHTTHCYYTAQR